MRYVQMGEFYDYWVCRDMIVPALIRLGSNGAERYSYPGCWDNVPHLNDIRTGKGNLTNYEKITNEEAEIIRQQIQAYYDGLPVEEG